MARLTDPQTSKDAEMSITSEHKTKLEAAILDMLRYPRTDEALVDEFEIRYRTGHYRFYASPSGIRTRRCHLFREGKVVDTGFRIKTRSGRNAIVWRAA